MHYNGVTVEVDDIMHRDGDETLCSLSQAPCHGTSISPAPDGGPLQKADVSVGERISLPFREAQEMMLRRETHLQQSINIFSNSAAQQMDYLEKREAALDKRELILKEMEEQLARNERALISQAEEIHLLLESLKQKQELDIEKVIAQARSGARDTPLVSPQMRSPSATRYRTDGIAGGEHYRNSLNRESEMGANCNNNESEFGEHYHQSLGYHSQSPGSHSQASNKFQEGILSSSDPRAITESHVEELSSSDVNTEETEYESQDEASGHLESSTRSITEKKDNRKKRGIQGRPDFVPINPQDSTMDFFRDGPTADFERNARRLADENASNENDDFDGSTTGNYGEYVMSNAFGEQEQEQEFDEAFNYLIDSGAISQTELVDMLSSGTVSLEYIVNMAKRYGMNIMEGNNGDVEDGQHIDSENEYVRDIGESPDDSCRPKTGTGRRIYSESTPIGRLSQEDDQQMEPREGHVETSDEDKEESDDDEGPPLRVISTEKHLYPRGASADINQETEDDDVFQLNGNDRRGRMVPPRPKMSNYNDTSSSTSSDEDLI